MRLLVVASVLATMFVGAIQLASSASADAPSDALAWAEGKIGDSTAATTYDGLCLQFVGDAYANGAGVTIGSSASAVTYWNGHVSAQHAGDTNPPAGALVFWGATTTSMGYGLVDNPDGHVAIAEGGDTVVSSYERANHSIHVFTISVRNAAHYPYMGWMMPPGVTVGPPSTQRQWQLSNANDNTGAYTAFNFGLGTDHPIVGDWDGDGVSSKGIVRDVNGGWQWHLSNTNDGTGAYTAFNYGIATDTPIVGDWDGNGTTTPGVVRNVSGGLMWYLSNTNDGAGSFTSFSFGVAGMDSPIVGDWNGDGSSTIGIVRNVSGGWQWHLSNTNDSAGAYTAFSFGAATTDIPIVGDWNGDGTSTPGVVRNVGGNLNWYLSNTNDGAGAAVSFSFGLAASDFPIVGDWDGDGSFTKGLIRTVS